MKSALRIHFAISALLVVAVVVVPRFAFAAANDVILASDASFSVAGVTLTVQSGAQVAGITVNSGSIDFNLESGSFATVTSPDKYTLSNSQATTNCHSDYSYITLTSTATQTITVTPNTSRASCYGGGSGQAVATTATTVVATTTEMIATSSVPVVASAALTETQIQAIVSLLNSFGADATTVSNVSASLRGQATTGTTGTAASVTFTRDLTAGSKGADVKALQQFLNSNGYAVSASGAGSVGNETETFGPATRDAVRKYQDANAASILAPVGLISGTGYFGQSTRNYINSLGIAE